MNNKKHTTALLLPFILIILAGLTWEIYRSCKHKETQEHERISFIIDSVRSSVIDSMQKVMKKQVQSAIYKDIETIELYDLVNLFIPGEDVNYNLLDWKTEANNPLINWLTNGIEMNDSSLPDSPPFYREGNTIVSINGKILECLDRNSYPCKWNITLCGAGGGYSSFVIRSVNHQDLEKMSISELFKNREMQYSFLKSEDDSYCYKVRFPGKKPCEMIITWSCGSAGCSLIIECNTNSN